MHAESMRRLIALSSTSRKGTVTPEGDRERLGLVGVAATARRR